MRTAEHRFYVTTAERCSCQGFATHQRCKHVAAVRAELASRVCRQCGGTGRIPYRKFNPYASEHAYVRCACQPAPADPWKFWS